MFSVKSPTIQNMKEYVSAARGNVGQRFYHAADVNTYEMLEVYHYFTRGACLERAVAKVSCFAIGNMDGSAVVCWTCIGKSREVILCVLSSNSDRDKVLYPRGESE